MAIGPLVASSFDAGSGSNSNVAGAMPAFSGAGYAAMAITIPSTTITMTTPPAGWTPLNTAGGANDGSQTIWLYGRTVTSALSAAAITATLSANNRWAGTVVVGPLASGIDALSALWSETTADLTLSVPALTPGVADACLVALVGTRYTNITGTIAPPTGWTEPASAEHVTTNTTAPFQGGWAAYKQLTGQSGVSQAATTAAVTPTTPAPGAIVRNIGYVFTLVPTVGGSVAASAGTAQTPAAFDTVTLVGTESGGSGAVSSRAWTQTGGTPAVTLVPDPVDPHKATYLAPGKLTGPALTFQYAVTDSNGTSSTSTVSHVVKAAPWRMSVSGVLVPLRVTVAGAYDAPPQSTAKLYNAFPGGGGQAAVATSPFSSDFVALATDTAGARFSPDGTRTSYTSTLGLDSVRAKLADGLACSRVVPGKVFMTCGDGTASGGVYVSNGADSRDTTGPWVRLDGIASGAPQLRFTGGNNVTGTYPTGLQSTYPRHYGTIIEIDDQTLAGYTFLHVATVNNGAWRIKVRNSDNVPLEQIQYAGTSGLYIRSLRMATFGPNAAANDYSRIIINVYNDGAPTKPILCTNANDTGATPTLATATITAAPANVQNIGYGKSSVAGAVPLAVFVRDGGVYFSTNAFTAAAGSITFSGNLVRTQAQGDGPEDVTTWISCSLTQQDNNHVILIGSSINAPRIGALKFNTVWRGVVPATSATPATATAWTGLGGSAYWSEQVLNRPGASNKHWLAGTNAPGLYGSAAVSAFGVSAANPARVYAIARGNTFMSDDYGLHWYESRTFGSASHFSIAWDKWVNKSFFATTTGDWPFASATDAPPADTFESSEPHAVLKFGGLTALNAWFDPKTGEVLISGSKSGSHAVPPHDAGNTVWGMNASDIGQSFDTLDATTDYHLATGNTATAGAMCGVNAYGPGGTTRAIIVGTYADGMFYTKNNGTTWSQVTAVSGGTDPFKSPGGYDGGVAIYDQTRSVVYFMDRGQNRVWRASVATDGTVSQATCVLMKVFTGGGASPDGVGYIDLDEANDRLWVSVDSAVYFIPTASTAAHVADDSNGTSIGFATKYPGEIAGPMCFLPGSGRVCVAFQGYNNDNPIYPLNGVVGPRFLVVSSPSVAANWAPASSSNEDWGITRDHAYQLGMTVPWNIARNWDGSIIALTSRGGGVGVWYV